jgi:tetratricopeptide (TPR) repeat protein
MELSFSSGVRRDRLWPWSKNIHDKTAIFRQVKHEDALVEFDRMIALDPNFAQGHAARGLTLTYAGKAARALEPFAMAMRLDPHYP